MKLHYDQQLEFVLMCGGVRVISTCGFDLDHVFNALFKYCLKVSHVLSQLFILQRERRLPLKQIQHSSPSSHHH
jgi:hypothetical protein